jgi:hypothetical protein
MKTICGANCDKCSFKASCKGCEETCGRPFGGSCTAAEYIRAHGREEYEEFKKTLLGEVNGLLGEFGAPAAEALHELPGSYVNLAYPLPGGEKASFLDGKKVYLAAQVELGEGDRCCGAVADTEFILVCRYGEGGSEPELLAFRSRR